MTKQRTLLLDADVLCHQFAYRNTNKLEFVSGEEFEHTHDDKALLEFDSYTKELMETTGCTDVVLVVSCRELNWRKQFEPTYKAKRSPKPKLWETIREHVEFGDHGYPVAVQYRLEGDDVLGILHTTEYAGRSVIASIDKDMKTVPGLLFNPNKPDLGVVPVSPDDAMRFHLWQTLVGDSVDEYPGLRGVGPKNTVSVGILEGDIPLADCWSEVVRLYESKGFTEADAIHQARLAFILRGDHYNEETNKIKLWKPTDYSWA